jgi:hypothetical protein
MTFLEFVLTEGLGPATRSSGNGESFWPCAECGHDSFHTMPTMPQYKDRARCFRCDFRGDVTDMLQRLFPHDTKPQHHARMDRLFARYQSENAGAQATPLSSPGAGTLPQRVPDDERAIATVWADLREPERAILIAARRIMRRVKAKGVSFEGLAEYCLTLANHMKLMTDVAEIMADDDQPKRKGRSNAEGR